MKEACDVFSSYSYSVTHEAARAPAAFDPPISLALLNLHAYVHLYPAGIPYRRA